MILNQLNLNPTFFGNALTAFTPVTHGTSVFVTFWRRHPSTKGVTNIRVVIRGRAHKNLIREQDKPDQEVNKWGKKEEIKIGVICTIHVGTAFIAIYFKAFARIHPINIGSNANRSHKLTPDITDFQACSFSHLPFIHYLHLKICFWPFFNSFPVFFQVHFNFFVSRGHHLTHNY